MRSPQRVATAPFLAVSAKVCRIEPPHRSLDRPSPHVGTWLRTRGARARKCSVVLERPAIGNTFCSWFGCPGSSSSAGHDRSENLLTEEEKGWYHNPCAALLEEICNNLHRLFRTGVLCGGHRGGVDPPRARDWSAQVSSQARVAFVRALAANQRANGQVVTSRKRLTICNGLRTAEKYLFLI